MTVPLSSFTLSIESSEKPLDWHLRIEFRARTQPTQAIDPFLEPGILTCAFARPVTSREAH